MRATEDTAQTLRVTPSGSYKITKQQQTVRFTQLHTLHTYTLSYTHTHSYLCVPVLVTHLNHGHPVGQQQRRRQVAHLALAQPACLCTVLCVLRVMCRKKPGAVYGRDNGPKQIGSCSTLRAGRAALRYTLMQHAVSEAFRGLAPGPTC